MATDILTSSGIISLVNSYTSSQVQRLVSPLKTKQSKYQNLSTAYDTLTSKLSSFKTLLSDLKQTGTDSYFTGKSASTSNSDFITATATNAASASSFALRVSQLAKSDVVVSSDLTAATANSITGSHSFVIKTGDGSTGEYTSTINVDFNASETNQTVMEKIRDAINSDKAEVNSTAKSASSSYSGGATSFVINLNGTETTISLNGGGTYEQLIDEAVSNINDNVSGVTAEKVLDSVTGNVNLKLSVDDSSNYISISHSSGFDVVSDLGMGVTKEKGASGLVTASAFAPNSSTYQLSVTSKESGLDNRITDLADISGTALSSVGLNLGVARPSFDQSATPDTAGFIYSDVTEAGNLLNSKMDFNGLTLQRNSNTVSDLVSGVTFQLKSVMQASDTTVSVSVSNDVSAVKSKIEDFIKKFNDVYTYLKDKSTTVSDKRGIFIGDANASSILDSLTSLGYSQISGLPDGDLSYLSQIGLSFTSSSGLSISDSSTLEKKIADSADQVEALFNSANGIANTLYDKVDPYLGSDGYLTKTKSSFDSNIKNYSDRIISVQNRIDKSAESLRGRYEQLQVQLVSLINMQSMYGFSSSSNGYF